MEGLIKGLVDAALGNHNQDVHHNNNLSSSSMEGKIKGLVDAALGNHNQDDHHNNNNNNSREGLIKGLIDVALGNHNQDDHHNKNKKNSSSSPSRQDLSRSTWAQVVSGDDEENGQEAAAAHHYNRHPRYTKEEDDGRNEGLETVGHRPPPRSSPHKVSMDQWHGYKRPPSEQEYSNEDDLGADIEPSDEELTDLSRACNKLWDLDSNRLVPGKDYEIDCGEGKKAYQKEDMAQGSLFSWLRDDIFRRPTYSRFCSLLDNYNPNEGCRETVTSQERQEQAAFIEEISRTAPIKYLHKYLVAKGFVSERNEDFKRMMTDLWFELYSRGGTSSCSSAFEHVFVGEIKQRGENEVSGFHNWIQFYLEEAKGRVDYQGYIFPRRRGQILDSETQLLTVQFEWNGVLKSLSSTLIGVSPEFEIALFTLCFYLGEEDNHVQLGPYPVNIKCYHMGRDKIGSVFPIAEC